jgi:hypothetical protein
MTAVSCRFRNLVLSSSSYNNDNGPHTSPRDHILHGSLHIIQLALHLDEFLAKLCYLLLEHILLKLCSICALALQLDVGLRLCLQDGHVCFKSMCHLCGVGLFYTTYTEVGCTELAM